MPGDPREIALLMRQWQGVNIAIDPAYLGDNLLQRAENWVPDTAFLLSKKRGTLPYEDLSAVASRVLHLRRTYNSNADRLLFSVLKPLAANDTVYLNPNDTASMPVTTGTFTIANGTYGSTVMGDAIYIGNGVDPLKRIPLMTAPTAEDLASLPVTTGETVGPTAADSTNASSTLLNGTYTYAWGIYDTSVKHWTGRSAPQTFTVSGNARQVITFTAPATAVGGTEAYHLFVAPANLPIEFAHDQTAEGVAPSATFQLNAPPVVDSTPVPLPGVVRTGNILVSHRGRIWLAGNAASPSQVFASNILVEGLEQDLFDQGDFFPSNAVLNVARDDGDVITGLAVATLTSTQRSPTSPLAIFKQTSTWLLVGDILDDPSATLVQISSQVGCYSPNSVVNTPVGVIFCGERSVYLLPPDLQEPIDIGWTIAPVIRNIPSNAHGLSVACFHHGFYKLSIATPGGTENTQDWWLDLRRGLQGTPSWWGPHNHTYATRGVTVGARETLEQIDQERAWLATEDATIHLLEQQGSYHDRGATIVSRFGTSLIDARQPFQRKTFTRIRATAKSDINTSLSVVAMVDEGRTAVLPPLPVGGATLVFWDKTWDKTWGFSVFAEGESIWSPDRLRGRTIEVTLTHNDPDAIQMRDFELRYLPVDRPVGYKGEKGTVSS